MSNNRAIMEKHLGTASLVGTKEVINLLEREFGVDTVAELRALPIDVLMKQYGAAVLVRGNTAAFDWIPRYYEYNSLSVAPHDGDLTVAPDPDKSEGRWEAQFGPSFVGINDQTGTSYQYAISDASKYVRHNNALAITATVPGFATTPFAVGHVIHVGQIGVGQVTFGEGAGVTINTAETLKLRKQHSRASLINVAQDIWDLTGDLELV